MTLSRYDRAPERAVVYDQVASNRRRTWLLLALSAVVSLPSFLIWAPYALVLSFILAVTAVAGLGAPLDISVSIGAGIAVFTVVLLPLVIYRHAVTIALRVARATPVLESDAFELSRTVDNLCIAAGLPPPALYVVESEAPNAFSVGTSPSASILVVTRGLLNILEPVELEGVVAHELSHIGNEDTRLGTLIAAQVALLWLPWRILSGLVHSAFRMLARVSRVLAVGCALYLGIPLVVAAILPLTLWREDTSLVLVQLAGLAAVAYSFFGAPLLATVIGRGVWREREHLADANGFLLTRRPDGLATALAKLEQAASVASDPAATTLEHLYVVDPTPSRWEGWRLTATHPPLEERLNRIAAMGGGAPAAVLDRARAAAGALRQSSPPPPAPGVVEEAAVSVDRSEPRREAASSDVGALRLGASTPLLVSPEPGANILEIIPAGTLVVVLSESGDFYEILSRERFGFISRATPAEPFDTSRLFPVPGGPPEPDDPPS